MCGKNNYEKGKIFSPVKNIASEGVMVELTPHGLDIIVLFNNPTESEAEEFLMGKYFEIRETIIYDKVIYFTLKIGDLPWQDAPYTPHLTVQMPDLKTFADGIPATMFLIDLKTKIIKSEVRTMLLSERFTEKLVKDIEVVKSRPFSEEEYKECIAFAQKKYSPEGIAELSENICKINASCN